MIWSFLGKKVDDLDPRIASVNASVNARLVETLIYE
jgi:hypothetical protein